MKNKTENKKNIVYYDGACHVCSREMTVYQKESKEKLCFVDISSPNFIASQQGLDSAEVQKKLHVRKTDGSIVTGIDAFIAIWETMPKYHLLIKIAQLKPIRFLMDQAYIAFAHIRSFLPKRKNSCRIEKSYA